jgi:hypothetical protein
MRLHHIAAALAAASLLTASPGSGDARAAEAWARVFPPACTPEAQRCLEKLETQLYFHGRAHDAIGIEQALLELEETDPECAFLLRSVGLHRLRAMTSA